MKRQLVLSAVVHPIPQPRQRHAGNRSYIPEKHPIHNFKSAIRAAAERTMRGRPPLPVGAPLTVFYRFVFARPKSERRSIVRTPHLKETADSDNLQKAVQDACTGILWPRDGAVWKWGGEKWIAATGETPSVEITVRW